MPKIISDRAYERIVELTKDIRRTYDYADHFERAINLAKNTLLTN